MYNGTTEKSGEADVETTGGFEMYKLTYRCRQNSLRKHGKSSCIEPNHNLIMLAIQGNDREDKLWLIKPGKYAMTKLEVKGKDPNQWYEQTDTYGSWRDMRNTGLRNAFLLQNPNAE